MYHFNTMITKIWSLPCRHATTHLRGMRAILLRVGRFATQSANTLRELRAARRRTQHTGHLSTLYRYTALAAFAKSRVLCHWYGPTVLSCYRGISTHGQSVRE